MRISSLAAAAAIVLLSWQAAAQNLCIPAVEEWKPVVVDRQQYAAWLRTPEVWQKLRRQPGQFPLYALTDSGFKVPFEGVCNAACAQKGQSDQDLDTIATACAAVYKDEYCFNWTIPTNREFEWTGRFVIKSLGVDTGLIIRGKQQNGSFDILMQQGCTSEDDPVCVRNVVKDEIFYTVTSKWPEIEGISDINGKCVHSTNPVTVDDLNFLLASARFVGTEEVDQMPVDHFRASCIGRSVVTVEIGDLPVPICQQLSVFSDLYVPRGRGSTPPSGGKPFYKWFQYGDGVGLDPQQDEWFIIDNQRRKAGPIEKPPECVDPNPEDVIPVLQQPCKNLIYLQ